jgi:hypothetical protein
VWFTSALAAASIDQRWKSARECFSRTEWTACCAVIALEGLDVVNKAANRFMHRVVAPCFRRSLCMHVPQGRFEYDMLEVMCIVVLCYITHIPAWERASTLSGRHAITRCVSLTQKQMKDLFVLDREEFAAMEIRIHLCASRIHLCASRIHLCASRIHLYASRIHLCASRIHLCASRIHLCAPRIHLCASHITRHPSIATT